jgi:hypothetical protein
VALVPDPFKGVAFEKAMAKLIERFGAKNVQLLPADGSVVIDMPIEGQSLMFTAALTWQEAKYLAFNSQITPENLRDQELPTDWPART